MVWNMPAVWLVVLIGCLLVEVATMGLATIWFAIGAVPALITALIGLPLPIQCAVFGLVSLIMLVTTRPLAVKHFNRERALTNAESLIGTDAIVVAAIDNIKGLGLVRVQGQEWTARSEKQKTTIPVGSVVEVVNIQGVKLIVRERN